MSVAPKKIIDSQAVLAEKGVVNIDQDTGTPYSKEQLKKIYEYFKKDPKITKLPRTLDVFGNPRAFANNPNDPKYIKYRNLRKELGFELPYSVESIELDDTNPEKGFIILYHGKGTEKKGVAKTLLGQGVYGRVKLAQELITDESDNLIGGKVLAAKVIMNDPDSYLKEKTLTEIIGRYFGSRNKIEVLYRNKVGSRNKTKLLYRSKHCLVSDFITGIPLYDFLRSSKYSVLNKLEAVLSTMEDLRKLHGFKIVHGDLHCDNVLVNKNSDEKIEAYIIDLGFHGGGKVDSNGIIQFSPFERLDYPPECSSGRGSYSLDIYKLGYEIKLHIALFENNPLLDDLAKKMQHQNPTNRPSISTCIEELKKIILQQLNTAITYGNIDVITKHISQYGREMLSMAIKTKKLPIIALLLKNGINGTEALYNLVKNVKDIKKDLLIIKSFLPPNMSEDDCKKIFIKFAKERNTNAISLLLSAGFNDSGEEALTELIEQENPQQNQLAINALLVAGVNGLYLLNELISDGNSDKIKLLLDSGLKLSKSDYGTILYNAAQYGHPELFPLLLEHNANIDMALNLAIQ